MINLKTHHSDKAAPNIANGCTHKNQLKSHNNADLGNKPLSPQLAMTSMHGLQLLQRTAGNQAVGKLIQAKLNIGKPGDRYEKDADRTADKVMKMSEPEEQVQKKSDKVSISPARISCKGDQSSSSVDSTTAEKIESTRGSGQRLSPITASWMSERMGADFNDVRIHSDSHAAQISKDLGAQAFTVGKDIYFGTSKFDTGSSGGKKLLAHELTHVVQQTGNESDLDRPVVNQSIRRKSLGQATSTPVNEFSPPEEMKCVVAQNSPGAVVSNLTFGAGLSTLSAIQKAEVDAAAASWHAAGGSVSIRVDGYASQTGDYTMNWHLSCHRAESVVNELQRPSDGSPGVPGNYIQFFAHGETNELGNTPLLNQRATISIPDTPPLPKPPSPPSCSLPAMLGRDGGCGGGPDFMNFDFPTISSTSMQRLRLWAITRSPMSMGSRARITNSECETEMDTVLSALAGGAGHRAFSRFSAGTGGTERHGNSSLLGAMALTSGTFQSALRRVKTDIEAQLRAQASSGTLNPCRLSVTPPLLSFSFSDGTALKAVIGGTQGAELWALAFVGDILLRSYVIKLQFLICDDFGVDESDLYSPGLMPFWVLQHERSPSRYIPFINQLDLSVTVGGIF